MIKEEKESHKKKPILRLIIIGLVFLCLIAASFLFPLKTYVVFVLEWTENLGAWAPVAVIGIYIAACVFFLPGSIITLGAGFLFGVVKGTLVVSAGSTLGAVAAFIVGRTLLRDRIEKKTGENVRFKAIDQAVGDQGFKIVFLARLSPILPFNLLNYAFGVTRVPLWKYFLASWIGMLPATFMYVYFGSALGSFAELASGSIKAGTSGRIFFWVGLGATIVVVAIITRIAGKAFKSAVPGETTPTL